MQGSRTARIVGRNLALSSDEIALLETYKIDRRRPIIKFRSRDKRNFKFLPPKGENFIIIIKK
ncbi:hypothetical protein [Campylobacter rectus]|uniref:hypothetical protein n=1 Tax=Campylobacter rectus TaxID=203 RepID=UPI000F5D9C9B|nr:hypothetical protein [Campylobacter rectus]RRD53479.1 hypothetical protein EII16_08870 [Campylobacter rectus]